MLRRLFIAASVVSLLVCIAATVMWVRDWDSFEQVGWAVPVLDEHGQPTMLVEEGPSDAPLFAPERPAAAGYPRTVIDCNVYGLRVCRGTCALGVTDLEFWPERPGWYRLRRPAGQNELWPLGRLGFGFAWRSADSRGLMMLWHREVFLPLWFIVASTAVLPAAALTRLVLRRRRTRHRLATGVCLRCAYDLRASRERCPECGRPIPQKAEVTE